MARTDRRLADIHHPERTPIRGGIHALEQVPAPPCGEAVDRGRLARTAASIPAGPDGLLGEWSLAKQLTAEKRSVSLRTVQTHAKDLDGVLDFYLTVAVAYAAQQGYPLAEIAKRLRVSARAVSDRLTNLPDWVYADGHQDTPPREAIEETLWLARKTFPPREPGAKTTFITGWDSGEGISDAELAALLQVPEEGVRRMRRQPDAA